MDTQTVQINRDDLAKFIPDKRTIVAFENIGNNQDQLVTNVTNILSSPVLMFGPSATYSNSRVIAGSADVQLTDAGGNISISLTPSGVSAAVYGSPTQLAQVQVDAKGRVTLAANIALQSGNVAETTNLYFTEDRARQSLVSGDGIDYDDVTGTIAVLPAGTYGLPTGTLARATFVTYTAPVISAIPTQAEVQAIADAVQVVSRTLAALIVDLQANGNLA